MRIYFPIGGETRQGLLFKDVKGDHLFKNSRWHGSSKLSKNDYMIPRFSIGFTTRLKLLAPSRQFLDIYLWKFTILIHMQNNLKNSKKIHNLENVQGQLVPEWYLFSLCVTLLWVRLALVCCLAASLIIALLPSPLLYIPSPYDRSIHETFECANTQRFKTITKYVFFKRSLIFLTGAHPGSVLDRAQTITPTREGTRALNTKLGSRG